jgi:hypothetical protein
MGYSFTFRFSEKDINFSPRSGRFFNYNNFLINEFFNSTDEEVIVIMKDYRKKFGLSAYKYVMKNYFFDWRRGNRSLSNVQEERIRSIMPGHLNEKAKNTLSAIKEEAKYQLGHEEVIYGIKKTVQSYFQNQQNIYSKEKIQTDTDIQNVFHKEIKRADNLSLVGSFYVLDETEKDEVLKISKYIVFVKLQNQFDQIEKDFNTFIPYIKIITRGIFSASFFITTFNINIDLTKIIFQKIKVPTVLIDAIIANSQFKEFSDKYLANELVTINTEANKAVSNSFLNTHDLQLFFNHYDELLLSDSEVDMKSLFKGESGCLNIQINIKPLKMLKTSIAKSISKILIYTIIVSGMVLATIRNEWLATLYIGGVFLFGLYYTLVNEEIKLIKHFKTEIKQYGYQ